MFILKRHPAALEAFKRGKDVISAVRRRIDDATLGLEFEPDAHAYTFYGRPVRNVSSIVERFAPFDATATAEAVSRNPRHPLYGKPVPEILLLWEMKGREASQAGTAVHSFAEACCDFLAGETPGEPWAERLTDEGLVAETPKEEAAARWWADFDWERYVPVAKEIRLVHPTLGYAGTPDLLLYDFAAEYFRLKDYKTNEDPYKWYGGHLLAPLSAIKDNDIGKYTLQQTLYDINLVDIGIPVGSIDLVWLRDDATYEQIPIPLQHEHAIRKAMENLND